MSHFASFPKSGRRDYGQRLERKFPVLQWFPNLTHTFATRLCRLSRLLQEWSGASPQSAHHGQTTLVNPPARRFFVWCMHSNQRHALRKLTGPTPCRPFTVSSTTLRQLDSVDALRVPSTWTCFLKTLFPWPWLEITFGACNRSPKQGSCRRWAHTSLWSLWSRWTSMSTGTSRLRVNRLLSDTKITMHLIPYKPIVRDYVVLARTQWPPERIYSKWIGPRRIYPIQSSASWRGLVELLDK